jgi:monovalent cation:H+ antiporter-2, CPA2 family
MEIPILSDIVIILGLSVLIILIFQRIKVPAIIGFLLTGVVCGPYGLSLVKGGHEVELLAEIGVIFLLFVIGIEFSLKSLIAIKRTVFLGGMMQVFGTIGLTAVASYYLGLTLTEAVFMGFLLSLSSTAIVLKMLQERGEINSPHGRISVAILIFQDLIVVPMMLLTPIIAGVTENVGLTLGLMLLKVLAVVGFVIVLARYVVPKILNQVVKTKSRELFILTVVVICFGTAWLTSSVGLSLALGAFFAGLIISESEYSHQATANILPFREIFISFFFVSVGMLLDVRFFLEHIFTVHLFALAVVLLKLFIVLATVFILRYPPRTIFITAFYLFQVGEFAFLLSTVGMQHDVLSREIYQYFLAISIITMGATPFVINYAARITDYLIKAPLPKHVRKRINNITRKNAQIAEETKDLDDHVVIIGYGINGKNVANAARQAGIEYIVIELDPELIAEARKLNEHIIYGDATDETILKHVHINKARVVVVAISDPKSTKTIVHRVREYTETAWVIVRTRYIREIEENMKLGADEVIPEEFETSIEIFSRVLKKYLVPTNEIQAFVTKIRSHNYEQLRISPTANDLEFSAHMHIPDVEIATLPVMYADDSIVGKTIANSKLRTRFGVTVLAIKRGDDYQIEITNNTVIKQDDILYLFGKPECILKMNDLLGINQS